MIHIALVDPELASAVVAAQAHLEAHERDLDVVWSGPNLDALLNAHIEPAPDVVVLDRGRLPVDPTATLQRLRKHIPARTVITTYSFAQGRDIEALRRAGSDVVLQGPLSVRTLRTHLLSLLIERRLHGAALPAGSAAAARLAAPERAAPAPPRQRASTPPPGPSVEDGPVLPPRFSRNTLLALRDLASSIQCECPNHLSELVERLVAFESYTKDCENRDDADAEIHRALWFATARARRILEDALEKLMAHEKITVEGTRVIRVST